MKIELFHRLGLRGWRFYFRIRARNGRIVAQSEGYRNRGDAIQTINLLKGALPHAAIEEFK